MVRAFFPSLYSCLKSLRPEIVVRGCEVGACIKCLMVEDPVGTSPMSGQEGEGYPPALVLEVPGFEETLVEPVRATLRWSLIMLVGCEHWGCMIEVRRSR